MATNCLALAPALLGFVSLLLGLISGLWCRLVYLPANPDFRAPNGVQLPQDVPSSLSLGVYLWREPTVATTVDSCVVYSFPLWQEASAGWKTVIVTQPLSWVVAFLLSFCLLISTCCAFPRAAYRAIAALMVLVCCPLQALVFLVLTSNMCTASPQLAAIPVNDNVNLQQINYFSNACQLGTAGYLAIGAVVGYFWTGLLCLCLRSPSDGSGATTATSSVGTKQQPPSTAPPSQTPPPGRPAAAAGAAAGLGAATVASNGTRPTYPPPAVETYDEENPAAIAAVAAAGGAAVGAAGLVAASDHRRRRSNMSPEEQRDLVQAAAIGAAVGASARADSLHNVPAIVRVPTEDDDGVPLLVVPERVPVEEIVVGAESNPEEQVDLVVAAASGAAVGARARADTVQDVPKVVIAEGDATQSAPVAVMAEADDETSLSHKPDPPGSQEEPSGELGRSSEEMSDSYLEDDGGMEGAECSGAAAAAVDDDDNAATSDDQSSGSAIAKYEVDEDEKGAMVAQDESLLTDDEQVDPNQSAIQQGTDDGGDDDSAMDGLRSERAVAEDVAATESVSRPVNLNESTLTDETPFGSQDDTCENGRRNEGHVTPIESSDPDPQTAFDDDLPGNDAETSPSLDDASDGSDEVKADSYSVD